MGIGVGGNYSNKTKTVREIKDTQGKVVGRITISKPKKQDGAEKNVFLIILEKFPIKS